MKGTKAFRFAMLAALVAVTLPWSAFAEPVDICGRTGVIRQAILSALTVPPDDPFNGCAMVDSDALAAIERLQVRSHAAVPTLLKGDFDGLSGLRYLDMSDIRFATLPVGAFDGLTLYELELHIYRLPAGVFDGLTFADGRGELDLSVEQKTLPAGVFDGLTLGRLDLGGNNRNQLVSLPAGVFDGLSVDEIDLSTNQLQDLPKGVFDGLTLSELDLSDNQLTTIDAGTFEGLAFQYGDSHLLLNRNRLRTIQDGAFDGMEVGLLDIWQNRTPMTIEAGAFDGLTVTGMLLADSKIERIDAGAFDGLTFHPINAISVGIQFDYRRHDLILSENRLTTLPRGVFHGVTGGLQGILLNDNELTTLPAGVFDGLANLGTLDLKNNELSALPVGLFRGIKLAHLNLRENDLTALPVGVFRGIFISDRETDNNTRLDLGGNPLTTIQADTFNGTIVKTLVFDGNPLTILGPGAFRGLVAAELLIWDSLLETIHPGAFEGFGPTDVFDSFKLSISNAPLATIHPGAFRGAEVSILELFNLPLLTTLRSGTFDGLTVQNIQIRGTALHDIEKGAFRGLQLATRFPFLFLGLIDNELTNIKPDMFDGLTETLGVLDLVGNRLSSIVAGSFDDLFLPSHCPSYCRLFLDGNHLVGLTRDDPLFANLQPTNDIGLERQKPHLRGGICDRSDVVIEAITSLDECADISSEQLAAMTSLNLRSDRLWALRAGDLDGFTSLRELSLDLTGTGALPAGVFDDLGNLTRLTLTAGSSVMMPLPVGVFDSLTSLTTLAFGSLATFASGLPFFSLHEGVFDKLTALTQLSISAPNLTTLPDSVFDNLTSLQTLTLRAPSLTTLPEGAFAKLTSLRELALGTGLTTLPPGLWPPAPGLRLNMGWNERLRNVHPNAFDGSALESLQLRHTRLTTLPEGVFEGLPLKFLELTGNRFNTLPAGTFDGLPELTRLSLAGNEITTLPEGLFRGISLEAGPGPNGNLTLEDNPLATIRAGAFSGLTVQELELSSLALVDLGEGAFRGLTVDQLYFKGGLMAIRAGVFDGTTFSGERQELHLNHNPLTIEPGAFEGVKGLRSLSLYRNFITDLAPGTFRGLNLAGLNLSSNALVTLPVDVFDGMTDALTVHLSRNALIALPAGLFDSLTLRQLYLEQNALTALPENLFDEQSKLDRLNLSYNQISTLPEGVFDELYRLEKLDLRHNNLRGLGRSDSRFAYFGHETAVYLTDQRAPEGRVPTAVARAAIPLVRGSSLSDVVRVINLSDKPASGRMIAVLPKHVRDYYNPFFLRDSGRDFGLYPNRTGTFRSSYFREFGAAFDFPDLEYHYDVETDVNVRVLHYEAFGNLEFGAEVPMHDVLQRNASGELYVPMFYTSNDAAAVSKLRLINTGTNPANVTVTGIDDRGEAAGPVTLMLDTGESRSLSAMELEQGATGLEGTLGAGAGSWRLTVAAGESVVGMSLFETQHGVTNLSTAARGRTAVPLLERAAVEGRQGFVRIINESGRSGTVRIRPHDDEGTALDALELQLGANQVIQFTADDLENGNAAKDIDAIGPPAQGDWRLTIETALDIQVLSYVRTNDGVVTSMHDVLQRDAWGRLEASYFPAQRLHYVRDGLEPRDPRLVPYAQAPKLRLTNTAAEATQIVIEAVNEEGHRTQGESSTKPVTFELGAGETRVLTGQELLRNHYDGYRQIIDDSRSGEFGELCGYYGCWLRLFVTAPPSVLGMVLYDRGGYLFNYSTAGTKILVEDEPQQSTIDVCDRTPQVRRAIVKQAEAAHCAAVLPNIVNLGISGDYGTPLQRGDFDDLSKLRKLSVRDKPLGDLPRGIFDGLSGLRVLELRGNGLETLPTGVFNDLSGLRELNLHGNGLETLPTGVFDDLSNLRALHLHGNLLVNLPDGAFDGLSEMQTLTLHGNRLVNLPEGVFDGLSELRELNLRGNLLGILPDGVFDELSSLDDLNLHENRLVALPEGVFDGLRSLQTLHLSANGLATLPERVFDGLLNLRELHLHRNRLTILPDDAFDGLPSLQQLNLQENRLAALPDGAFDSATGLEKLSLAGNSFQALPKDLFDDLYVLQTLDLSNNRLAVLPEGLFDGLDELRSLDLKWNRLTALPNGLFEGNSRLERADLRNNHLVDLDRGAPLFAGFSDVVSVHLEGQADVGRRHLTVPLLESASSQRRSFVRVVNGSKRSDRVRIRAFDDAGWAADPIEFDLGANQAFHFNASDLENGTEDGRIGGIGPPGQGDWRLGIEAGYGTRVLAYVSMDDGFLASIHDTLPRVGDELQWTPGSLAFGVHSVRLWNAGEDGERVIVDGGEMWLAPAESRTVRNVGAISAGTAVEGIGLFESWAGPLASFAYPPSGYTLSDATLPLLSSASDSTRQGIVGFVLDRSWGGYALFRATDDGGTAKTTWLGSVGSGGTHRYSADDLESGNLRPYRGIGPPGQGDWWRLDAGDFSAHTLAMLAYVRTEDDFVAAMHDRLPLDAQGRLVAWTFNPASNTKSESKLRLTNTGVNAETVSIEGVDDQGTLFGPVTLTLPAGESRTLSALDLEDGAQGLTGSLGDGAGRWRLHITAGPFVEGMNLVDSASGHLTNLSTEGSGGR